MTDSRQNIWPAMILSASAVGLYIGWREFWFLTDDAFIAFRYISNSHLGFGYVWNAPPFLPAEGYTSFLWVVLLDLIWRIFGIEPPSSANIISLISSLGTLILTALMFMKMRLPERMARHRPILLLVVMIGILSNRTFLAWSSSGLETSLFNFCLTLWIYAMIFIESGSWRRSFTIALAASLTYLTRPDGMLMVLATLIILAVDYIRISKEKEKRQLRLFAAWPLAIVPIHFLWRRWFYGEWLPNTYYAKYVSPWPEAGIRYSISFILEYALWAWIAIIVWWLWRCLRTSSTRHFSHDSSFERRFNLALTTVTITVHFLYYTLIIGGDHFEYRVYSHLIPLIFLTAVWLLGRLEFRAVTACGTLALLIFLSLPIPWTHYALTRNLTTRKEAYVMKVPVSEHFPGPIRWYAEAFDSLQFWLIDHHVCMRHQEHKVFCKETIATHPSRSVGSQIDAGLNPVIQAWTVGITGWVLPTVAVLDLFGLNDYVIARMPPIPYQERKMAHERTAPLGYIESYGPNIMKSWRGDISMSEREKELTSDSIAYLEQYWRTRVRHLADSLESAK